MPFIIPANTLASGGFDVANSARFNDGSSDYLDHTHNAVTSTRKQTFSVWVKRGALTSYMYIIATRNGTSTDRDGIAFSGSDQIDIRYGAGDSSPIRLTTNRLFRDVSSWFHIVVAVDTTQGTAANRIKLYVNGVQETSFATANYMDQNYDFALNAKTDQTTDIGNDPRSDGSYFDGYFSEFVAIDNQQLAADQFGEFDDSGIWKPIDVSGLTFGNAGFYMNFQTAAELGTDVSGNSNTFAENNLTAIDQSTDTCTNNFATLNPLALRNNPNAYYAVLSQGNLKLVGNSSTNNGNAFSTMGFNSGKWYCEVKMVDADNSLFPIVGVITEAEIVSANSPSNSGQIGTTIAGTVGYSPDGQKIVAGTESSYGNTFTNNDIIGIAIDCDNGAVYFSKNGTFQASGNPTSGSSRTNAAVTFTPSTNYFFGASVYKDTNDIDFNFGSPPFAISSGNQDGNSYGNFEYAVPSGYFSLNTKNLAEYG